MDENFSKRILELAQQQQTTRWRIEEIQGQIQPYVDEMKELESDLKEKESQLRADLLEYMTTTGDTKVHPSVSIRRTTKVMYDKEVVIQQLEIEGLEQYLRRRPVELNVIEFEKAVRAGEIDLLDVEIVNAPTVSIDKLGDLLIAFETGKLDENGNPKEA